MRGRGRESPVDGLLQLPGKVLLRGRRPPPPTDGDNIVSNYFHPCWARGPALLSVSLLISGPATRLLPVKHQWGIRETLVDPRVERRWGDKNVAGNPPHLMPPQSWASHLCKQEARAPLALWAQVALCSLGFFLVPIHAIYHRHCCITV